MPELPEVETTRTGIEQAVLHQPIKQVIIRERRLRWNIPTQLQHYLQNQRIHQLTRRAKYLLFTTDSGTLISHLGMSGCFRIVNKDVLPQKHDHVDFVFAKKILRYHDPRRFGCMLWTSKNPQEHRLLCNLGPEPLSETFNARHLHQLAANRHTHIKSLIMNQKVVVGVGNIYANEALFQAGISPHTASKRLSLARLDRLCQTIKSVLIDAIQAGGTTLKDFYSTQGKPGYFRHQLHVYDRQDQPCLACQTAIKRTIIANRSTFHCPNCQKR